MTFSSDDKIKQLQLLELEALKEIKKITDDNGITFFLRGGSVMGAVKYEGFVPWDDDVDIAIPRPHYEKFIKLMKENLSEKFWIASYSNDFESFCYFPRIFLREDVRKQNGISKNNLLGLCLIDCLPLDAAPKSRLSLIFYKIRVLYLRAIASTFTLNNEETVKTKKPIVYKVVKLLKVLRLNSKETQNQVYDKLDDIYKSNIYQDSEIIGTVTGSLSFKELFNSKVWGDGVKVPFEDTEMLIPEHFDTYLKKLYGQNYATEEPDYKKSHQEDRVH
ncbi:LicD family protein [Lactococcus lactis]|uniref:LicD family protein n=1 Tax=Lactococcus lactis TaxID=1358 RepID=UPI0022E8FBF3|nr:LicD family protein [Lactococcus lactis]